MVVVALVAVAIVQAWRFQSYPPPFDDEGTYVAQAWAFQTRGELSHYTYWYDHPPLGWIQLSAWTLATGAFQRVESALVAGREAMVLVHVVASALLYALARRMRMSRPAGLLAVGLFTLSPLALHYHRMVLLDNIAVPWILATFVLLHSPTRRLSAYVAAAGCFAAAVLTKETALLLLPVVAYEFWRTADPRIRGYATALAATVFMCALATYVLLASLKGELVPGPGHVSLWEGIQFQLFERQSTGSILEPGSVSSHTVQGWLHLDPWLLGVGLVLAPAAIATPKLRAVGFVLLTMSAAVLRDGYLPLMYVVAAIPFLALVVAGLVDGASQAVRLRSDRRLVPRSWSRVRRLVVRRSATAVLATLLALGIGIVAIDWAAGLRAQLEADSEAPFRAARSWISSNVTRETPLLVDNVMWMDLVLSKYERDSVISYWKLDLDPAIAERFPEGWRDFRYVVSTPDIRSSLDQLPNVDLALRNSRPVASFGQGAHRVEIRRIVRGVAGGGPPRTGG